MISTLCAWAAQNPKRLGHLSILFGLFLAGLLSNTKWPQLERPEWKEFTVLSVEKISSPHNGRVDREYRLHLSGNNKIGISSRVSPLFDQHLMLRQQPPTQVEVLTSPHPQDGVFWAQGLRLKTGETVLDPEAAHKINGPDDRLAWLIGGVFILLGVILMFVKAADPLVEP